MVRLYADLVGARRGTAHPLRILAACWATTQQDQVVFILFYAIFFPKIPTLITFLNFEKETNFKK
jgi:hypothetical protein